MSEQAAAKTGFLAGLTALQKLAMVVAAIVSVAGAGMWGVAAVTSPPARGGEEGEVVEGGEGAQEVGPGPAFTPEGFVDDQTAGIPAEEASGRDGREAGGETEHDMTALELYAPTVFRLGFAFFVGFAIAYALRAAFKMVLVVVGTVLLLLVGLQMAGLITVNWEAMQGLYETTTAWLATQTESLTAFLRGYIPSGGTALAGFGMGMLRRK